MTDVTKLTAAKASPALTPGIRRSEQSAYPFYRCMCTCVDDPVAESEAWTMAPVGVSVHVSRVAAYRYAPSNPKLTSAPHETRQDWRRTNLNRCIVRVIAVTAVDRSSWLGFPGHQLPSASSMPARTRSFGLKRRLDTSSVCKNRARLHVFAERGPASTPILNWASKSSIRTIARCSTVSSAGCSPTAKHHYRALVAQDWNHQVD